MADKKDVPLSGANMRGWSKIRAILGWLKFVSAYVERDKKIMKLAVFGFGVYTVLIENIARGLWLVGLAKVGPSSPTAPPRSALRYEIFALAPLRVWSRGTDSGQRTA